METETALTQAEQLQLASLEGVVSKTFRAFYEVGDALMHIRDLRRDRRLYRSTHRFFEKRR